MVAGDSDGEEGHHRIDQASGLESAGKRPPTVHPEDDGPAEVQAGHGGRCVVKDGHRLIAIEAGSVGLNCVHQADSGDGKGGSHREERKGQQRCDKVDEHHGPEVVVQAPVAQEQDDGQPEDHGPVGEDVGPVEEHDECANVFDGPGLPPRFPQKTEDLLQFGNTGTVGDADIAGVVVHCSAAEHVHQVATDVKADLAQHPAPVPGPQRQGRMGTSRQRQGQGRLLQHGEALPGPPRQGEDPGTLCETPAIPGAAAVARLKGAQQRCPSCAHERRRRLCE